MKSHFLSRIVLGAVVAALTVLFQSVASVAQVVAAGTKAVPVYRFYYKGPIGNHQHVYRTVPSVPGAGWQSEGISFYISPIKLSYTVPLYVVYHYSLEDHFYTIDIGARDNCVKSLGYVDQGIFGFVLPPEKDFAGSSSLYRWVHDYRGIYSDGAYRDLQDHFFQTSASPVANYKFEGIECRVWTEPVKLPYRLIQLSAPLLGSTLLVNETAKIGWRVWSGGGYIKLSYSKNSGSSWQPIATVANTGNFGDTNDQSYNDWKVPADAVGKILIKADWVKESDGSKLPWATDITGPRTVSPANFRVIRRL